MKEKPYSFPPFSSSLKPSDIPAVAEDSAKQEYIYQLEKDPEVVVRKVRRNAIFLRMGNEEVLRLAKREFDSLNIKYHIPVSANFVMLGAKGEDVTMYSITDRIHEVCEDEAEEKSARGEVAIRLLDYYYDKLETYSSDTKKTEYFLDDIGFEEQYVYGHTEEDPDNSFYLVDIDPENMSNTLDGILFSLLDIIDTLVQKAIQWNKKRGKSVEQLRFSVQRILKKLEEMEGSGYLENQTSKLENVRVSAQNAFADMED